MFGAATWFRNLGGGFWVEEVSESLLSIMPSKPRSLNRFCRHVAAHKRSLSQGSQGLQLRVYEEEKTKGEQKTLRIACAENGLLAKG